MQDSTKPSPSALPSVDRLVADAALTPFCQAYGRPFVTDLAREILAEARARLLAGETESVEPEALGQRIAARIEALMSASLTPLFNLTGTVLHTNLGRAPLPAEAVAAMAAVATEASNLEYDVAAGKRGERDDHVAGWLCRLTGAEAALVVNNNAAAVLLLLNSLANRRQVAVSRGELIEIGGAFRLPDIMARAGCKLVEVGTTNRTHGRDYGAALDGGATLVLKVHPSNYEVRGFTAEVPTAELAELARAAGKPLAVDLGSGLLVDMSRFGLPPEPTVAETLKAGADLVTFSGDKLLGGPQAGIIVGKKALIERLRRNPMKRALRLDKMTLAALGAVLRLYANPQQLPARLPALRLLTRGESDIRAMAERLRPELARCLEGIAEVEVAACSSQIGSGALPVETLPSAALNVVPIAAKRRRGGALERIAGAFRGLPRPVIGRVRDGVFVLDLRCLGDEDGFRAQLELLDITWA
ncbi:MAG: L-seryl-tRNA(Sec) selenium transferase [Alphaproteobacteria bacterium]|nr:L-seryl-tRNA(Sec) selenium transferase [Alphaproteobacteria bacterium]